jgi:hypothetical protein
MEMLRRNVRPIAGANKRPIAWKTSRGRNMPTARVNLTYLVYDKRLFYRRKFGIWTG